VHREGAEACKLYLSANDFAYCSPALAFADAHEAISSKYGSDAARECLRILKGIVSCVPLRNSTLDAALECGDVAVAGHISAKQLMGIDAVLTRTLDSAALGGLKYVTPEELHGLAAQPPSPTRVPFVDLKAQYPKIYSEIDDRFADIISNTGFILGPHVLEFESAFAKLQGAQYCVGLSTGTAALQVAFMALGIGPGDEVIVPVNTFIATAEAVSLSGATPVFVDSNEYFNIDVHKVRATLEARQSRGTIKAIVPVHLYGQPADLDSIVALASEFDVSIVEDCAQAHLAEYNGRKVGNDGQFGTFSYYPGKNLGAFGEAGSIVTNDEALYEKAKMIRAHGEATRYIHSLVGNNYRMAALQGAVLSTKSKYISEWTACRQRNARLYRELLADVDEIALPEEPEFSSAVYHLFVIQVDNRNELRDYLDDKGIATGLHYPIPLHLQKAYAGLGYAEGDFPVAERQARRVVSLPMYPELKERDLYYVCDSIKDFVATYRGKKECVQDIRPSPTTLSSAETFESTVL